MWPVVVVVVEPVFGECADFCQRVEDVTVQYAISVSPVKSFDVSVLGRLSFLNELQGYVLLGCPPGQFMADEFRAIIESNSGRLASDFDQFSQCTHDASCRQAGVDLDPQRLTVEIIQHVEGAESASTP